MRPAHQLQHRFCDAELGWRAAAWLCVRFRGRSCVCPGLMDCSPWLMLERGSCGSYACRNDGMWPAYQLWHQQRGLAALKQNMEVI